MKDRYGNSVSQFKTAGAAEKYVEKHATVEPHLKRTYPEHMRNPLPAGTGKGPQTGSFYSDKGLRPPKMDKKAREASAEYHYQHGENHPAQRRCVVGSRQAHRTGALEKGGHKPEHYLIPSRLTKEHGARPE